MNLFRKRRYSSMGQVNVNGKNYDIPNGASVNINNGKVIVNGVDITNGDMVGGSFANIHVTIEGDVGKIDCNGSVEVKGNSGSIECGGSCTIGGNVTGNVECGGSCQCGNVGGDVDAGGSVQCKR